MTLVNRLPELDDPNSRTWKKSNTITKSFNKYISLKSVTTSEVDEALTEQINEFTSYVKEIIEKIEQQKKHMSVLYRRSSKEKSKEAYGNITTSLDEIVSQVSVLSSGARKRIEEFKGKSSEIKNNKNLKLDDANRKVISDLISIYSDKLNDSVFSFTQESETLKKEIEGKLVNQAKIISNDFSDQQINDLIKSNDPAQYMRASVLVNQEVENRIGEIERTHEEIIKIEKGIAHVKSLFETLKFLVDQHQDVIDNIECNIINTKELILKGEDRLKESKKNVNKGNYIALSVIIIVIIVAIILLVVFNK
eukprot:GAHX01001135.1.p1 GENE.GAHX01001135.1~~GAHX01001135.1.p1  ORF type:complete len:308 (+),score=69.64 GAHX01001135.1:34-957(+)